MDHRHIAFAYRLAGDVHPVDQHAALGGHVEPGHHAHQRGLACLRGAEQHGDGVGYQRQVERVQVGNGTHALLDAFEHQFDGVSVGLDDARGVGQGVRVGIGVCVGACNDEARQCAAHQSTTACRCAALKCRPSLLRRHNTSSPLRAHSWSCR